VIHIRRGAAILLSCFVLLAVACTGGDDASTPEVTASAAPGDGASATATAAPISSLHDADFASPDLAGPLIDAAGGGEVPAERVHFADLVGNDGVDEAYVVVESGGTLGDLGVGVYFLEGGRPVLQQFIQTAGRVEFRLDLVVTLEGVWAAGDPQCCPSELRETSYQWDGQSFAAITEQVIPNPDR